MFIFQYRNKNKCNLTAEEDFFTKNYKNREKSGHFEFFNVFFDLEKTSLTIIVKFLELFYD